MKSKSVEQTVRKLKTEQANAGGSSSLGIQEKEETTRKPAGKFQGFKSGCLDLLRQLPVGLVLGQTVLQDAGKSLHYRDDVVEIMGITAREMFGNLDPMPQQFIVGEGSFRSSRRSGWLVQFRVVSWRQH